MAEAGPNEPALVDVTPQTCAVVRGHVPVAELVGFFDRSFRVLGETLAGQAVEIVGPAFARYDGPPADIAASANAKPGFHDQDPDTFWETEGRNRLSWFTPFETLKEWDPPFAKWYLGGKLNACYNCVDRHVERGLGEKVAYFWEGENPDDKLTITYADLQRRVVRAANGFKSLGIDKGTHVGIYMGMVPELPVTMLALTRLGAPFTVVFGGFSAESLGGRLVDMQCEYVVTQDGSWRGGRPSPLKPIADDAMAMAPTVRACVVVKRAGNDVTIVAISRMVQNALDANAAVAQSEPQQERSPEIESQPAPPQATIRLAVVSESGPQPDEPQVHVVPHSDQPNEPILVIEDESDQRGAAQPGVRRESYRQLFTRLRHGTCIAASGSQRSSRVS